MKDIIFLFRIKTLTIQSNIVRFDVDQRMLILERRRRRIIQRVGIPTSLLGVTCQFTPTEEEQAATCSVDRQRKSTSAVEHLRLSDQYFSLDRSSWHNDPDHLVHQRRYPTQSCAHRYEWNSEEEEMPRRFLRQMNVRKSVLVRPECDRRKTCQVWSLTLAEDPPWFLRTGRELCQTKKCKGVSYWFRFSFISNALTFFDISRAILVHQLKRRFMGVMQWAKDAV